MFEHLAGEHAELVSLMRRVAGTIELQVRQELFPEIRRGLLSHARAEEAALYPPLGELPQLRDLVARCLEDHAELERQLNRLDVKDMTTPRWRDLFESMVRLVEQHVAREERELFPRAQALLDCRLLMDLERNCREFAAREHVALGPDQ